jgi:hypothetical protein
MLNIEDGYIPSLAMTITYSHRAMGLEKDKVATMTTVHFRQIARHALVPMREATIDALLLTAFILTVSLVFPGILLNYTWVILPVYALAYLLTVVLRLRQASGETTEPRSLYNYLFH